MKKNNNKSPQKSFAKDLDLPGNYTYWCRNHLLSYFLILLFCFVIYFRMFSIFIDDSV